MSSKEERRAALLRQFRDVAAERIQTVSTAWLKLEASPSETAPADELFRELHTLKGEAKVVGLPDLSTLAHRLETLLFTVRDNAFRAQPETAEVVLGAVDALTLALNAPPGSATERFAALLSKMDAATGTERANAPAHAPGPASGSEGGATAAKPEADARGGSQSIRVREERIASISAVTGELLVEHSKAVFSVDRLRALGLEAARTADASVSKERWKEFARTLESELSGLDETTYRLGLRVRELDHTVRELRLVPVGQALEQYLRMVRDLAHEMGKQIGLEIHGGEFEADKRVLEILQEPLLHVLRNCVDHGIEPAEERKAKGKPSAGHIVLSVRSEGGGLRLTVSDDGRGLDPSALRRKAVQKALLSEEAANALNDAQALELIFLSGFSTRDEATQLSGRGVGMEVVKSRVEQLGGRVSVGGELGKGFSLEMRVPSSISMTRALVFPVAGTQFALPCSAVERLVHLSETELLTSHEGVLAEVGGARVPALALAPLLGHGGDARGGRYGLLVRSGAERCLLTTEEGGREVELVVKPVGPPLTHYRLLTGAAVLDSGELALVLDVGELFRMRRKGSVEGLAQSGRRRARAGTRVLLVEDSVIFRTTVGGLLSGLGCEVRLAENGMAGLAALESFQPELIVSDVQMPRMDGLEMTRRLRKDPRFARVPVVILSSLGSEEDRRRGSEAGADAYLIKSELGPEILGATLDRLLD